jgi:hypothetical protein
MLTIIKITPAFIAAVVFASLVPAEQPLADASPPAAKIVELPYETPIQAQLKDVFGHLAEKVKAADALAARLRDTAAKNPSDTLQQVTEAETILGQFVDQLAPNGSLAAQLASLRAAAAVHRKRVQDMPKDTIEETLRSEILSDWDRIMQAADAGQAAMNDLRTKTIDTLQRLRMRQVAIAELLLAGEFESAIKALNNWISDLQGTMGGLNQIIDQLGTTLVSHAPQS